MTASPEDLFRRLNELGIPVTTQSHPAVFTVEEAKRLRGKIPGWHVKNLFLRDKKGAMWLVVVPEDRGVNLKELAGALGAKRLSFGSPERLMHHLGVLAGAVTPFAVINDAERAVSVVLDEALLEGSPLNFHPLDNRMTTTIHSEDLLAFLEAEGHAPTIMDLSKIG
ncbi:prolyl-tRNA synthetase associated domain-containing protein [Gemmatimonadota bacterium]